MISSWQSGFIHTNGIRLHYTRTGHADGAKPPLIMAHGFSDDGLCWTSVAQSLEADYDIVMLDARGHGLSDAPEWGYGPLDQANDVSGVIEGLNLTRPIVLGHSMGAMTTLVLAGRHPDLVRAIVLEDPPPWWVADYPPAFNAEWLTQTRAWLTNFQNQSREDLIARQRAETPGWSEVELVPWADSKLRVDLKILDHLAPLEVDWPILVGGIRCPVLLIRGDPDRGALVTAEHTHTLQTWLPQLRVAHISSAGHSIRRDQSAAFMHIVRPFLSEVSRS